MSHRTFAVLCVAAFFAIVAGAASCHSAFAARCDQAGGEVVLRGTYRMLCVRDGGIVPVWTRWLR